MVAIQAKAGHVTSIVFSSPSSQTRRCGCGQRGGVFISSCSCSGAEAPCSQLLTPVSRLTVVGAESAV